MSVALPGTSSGATETAEEAPVVGDDALDRRRLGRRVPHVLLERAAQHDAVGARKHVAGASGVGVANLRLRLEDGELAAHWLKDLVPEQFAAAKSGAVEDEC